jgi:hypothetical protein
MAKQVVLLRVGIDADCGGIQGPLFKNGTFEFVCSPDRKRVSIHTYGNLVGRNGRYLVDYFPESNKKQMAEQPVQIDPEFETFTYGDPTASKQSLQQLQPGDFLVFYCGLQEWDSASGSNYERRPALYLAGYIEVALAGMAAAFDVNVLQSQFRNNFHVRYPSVFEQQKNNLVLVKGGMGSRLFNKAHRISAKGKDEAGKPRKMLLHRMQKVFGAFKDRTSIVGSLPHWIDATFDRAVVERLPMRFDQ